MAEFAEIEAAYRQFPEQVQSLMLSTVTAQGDPQASYAPFVMDGDRRFYVFVSGLSSHTANLKQRPQAGLLLIRDEAQTPQIFARQRLMYDCDVAWIERHEPQWSGYADRFKARFGPFIDMLRQLPDFQIFSLTPRSGRFVMGFGAAYQVDPSDIHRLLPNEK